MEEETVETPLLLKKKYYENCPGCKVDQGREMKKGVSFLNISFIWLAVLSGSKHFNSLPKFSSGVVFFLSACSCFIYFSTILSFAVKWLQSLSKLNYSATTEIFNPKHQKFKLELLFFMLYSVLHDDKAIQVNHSLDENPP